MKTPQLGNQIDEINESLRQRPSISKQIQTDSKMMENLQGLKCIEE